MYLPPDVFMEIMKHLRAPRKKIMYQHSVKAILSVKQHTSKASRTTTGKIITRNSVEVGTIVGSKYGKYLITKSYGALGIINHFHKHEGEPDDYHYIQTEHLIIHDIPKKK